MALSGPDLGPSASTADPTAATSGQAGAAEERPTDAPLAATPAVDASVDGIIARFRLAYRELRCIGSERMLRQGLSMGHLHALTLLERHGEMPMSGLADVLDASLSNTTGLVDRMEERGLVERHRVPDDRRVVMVRVTDRGREALAEADILKEDIVRSILESLDRPQLERLSASLDDIREGVERVLTTDPSAWHEHAHRHGHAHPAEGRPSPTA
jgi:DNA-binding MarR family transcriptional regulator